MSNDLLKIDALTNISDFAEQFVEGFGFANIDKNNGENVAAIEVKAQHLVNDKDYQKLTELQVPNVITFYLAYLKPGHIILSDGNKFISKILNKLSNEPIYEGLERIVKNTNQRIVNEGLHPKINLALDHDRKLKSLRFQLQLQNLQPNQTKLIRIVVKKFAQFLLELNVMLALVPEKAKGRG